MNHTHLVIKSSIACMCVLICGLFICACTQTERTDPTAMKMSTPSQDNTTNAEQESSYPTVGSGNSSALISNATGYTIIGIRIKPVSDADYSAENNFSGFEFKDGQTIDLKFTEKDSKTYDVLLLTSKDSKIAIRNIDLVNTKDIVFHFDKGIGYISYTDATTGKKVDNLEDANKSEDNASGISSDVQTQKG